MWPVHIITLSGPSGSGKTTVASQLLCSHVRSPQKRIVWLTSITTRPRRPDDTRGEYEYIDKEQFKRMATAGVFATTKEINHEWYGIKKSIINSFFDPTLSSVAIGVIAVTPDYVPFIKNYVVKKFPSAHPAAVYSFYLTTTYNALMTRLRTGRDASHEEISRALRQKDEWDELARAPGNLFSIDKTFFIKEGAPSQRVTQEIRDTFSAIEEPRCRIGDTVKVLIGDSQTTWNETITIERVTLGKDRRRLCYWYTDGNGKETYVLHENIDLGRAISAEALA